MKKKILLMALCFISLTNRAIENTKAVKTSTEGGRYELVQSEIMRKCFFKLDKYTGEVYQLVLTSDGSKTWQKMYVIGLSHDTIKDNTINFQIFIGGISASDCFMINIHTGTTYMLFEDTDSNSLYWSRIIQE